MKPSNNSNFLNQPPPNFPNQPLPNQYPKKTSSGPISFPHSNQAFNPNFNPHSNTNSNPNFTSNSNPNQNFNPQSNPSSNRNIRHSGQNNSHRQNAPPTNSGAPRPPSRPQSHQSKTSFLITIINPSKLNRQNPSRYHQTLYLPLEKSFQDTVGHINGPLLDIICQKVGHCNNEGAIQASAFSLLAIRSNIQSFTKGFINYLLQTCPQAFGDIIFQIHNLVLKCWYDFTPQGNESIYNLINELCLRNQPNHASNLILPLLTYLDMGFFTPNTLKMLLFFQGSILTYSNLWAVMEYACTLLCLKLLRFYQDLFILKDCQQTPESTSIIIPLDKFASSLAVPFAQFYSQHSHIINAYAPSTLFRILYDPRTYLSFQRKFPLLYQSVPPVSVKKINLQGIGAVDSTIVCHWLPYPVRSAMLQCNRDPNPKLLESSLQRPFPSDRDLILADFTRCYLLTIDIPLDINYNHQADVLIAAVNSLLPLKSEAPSFASALVSTLFFIEKQQTEIPKRHQEIIHLTMPIFSLIEKIFPVRPELSFSILKAIAEHLKQPAFKQSKRTSFNLAIGFLQGHQIFNFASLVSRFKLPETIMNEFKIGFQQPQQHDIVPEIVKQFKQSRQPLNSQLGMEAINATVSITNNLISGANQQSGLVAAVSILDLLVPPDRSNIELIYSKISAPVILAFSSRTGQDAKALLDFISRNRKYDIFDESMRLDYEIDLKFYSDELAHIIESYKESVIWKPFLTKAIAFRCSLPVIRAICFNASPLDIMELSLLPLFLDYQFPKKKTTHALDGIKAFIRLAEESANWPSDNKMNLIQLMKGRINGPKDFLPFQEWFAKTIDKLPKPIIEFFLTTLTLQGLTKDTVEFVKAISMAGRPEGVEFSQLVRKRWSLMEMIGKNGMTQLKSV